MTYNLFIDDMRNPSDVLLCLGKKWAIAHSKAEAVEIVNELGMPEFISFDHDMTDAHYNGDYSDGQTGADIAFTLVQLFNGVMCDYEVHSLNPDARKRIHDAIMSAKTMTKNPAGAGLGLG